MPGINNDLRNAGTSTLVVVVLLTAGSRAVAQTDFIPKAHHPNIAGITLFAENPDIMTPVGVAVAPDGRVFVQENHTHKRNSNYDGPKTDRILLFEDTDGDGTADKRSVFYEGHVFSTDLMLVRTAICISARDGLSVASVMQRLCKKPKASQKSW